MHRLSREYLSLAINHDKENTDPAPLLTEISIERARADYSARRRAALYESAAIAKQQSK